MTFFCSFQHSDMDMFLKSTCNMRTTKDATLPLFELFRHGNLPLFKMIIKGQASNSLQHTTCIPSVKVPTKALVKYRPMEPNPRGRGYWHTHVDKGVQR